MLPIRGQTGCPLRGLTFLIATLKGGQAFYSLVQKMHQSICKCAGKHRLNPNPPPPLLFPGYKMNISSHRSGLSILQVEGNTLFPSLVLATSGVAPCPAAFRGQSAASFPLTRDIPVRVGGENSPSCSPVPKPSSMAGTDPHALVQEETSKPIHKCPLVKEMR